MAAYPVMKGNGTMGCAEPCGGGEKGEGGREEERVRERKKYGGGEGSSRLSEESKGFR